ncbi:hypothetical protein GCM10007880_18270 [Mesorhizobium amorphae]|nr:hypothetical protein A6B35_27715 [Mesorhizobium amorphae CCNWGS0123]GLR41311.1 hypothetical protein GCM10007880_18270 [Mesorhizobium amorphae]
MPRILTVASRSRRRSWAAERILSGIKGFGPAIWPAFDKAGVHCPVSSTIGFLLGAVDNVRIRTAGRSLMLHLAQNMSWAGNRVRVALISAAPQRHGNKIPPTI